MNIGAGQTGTTCWFFSSLNIFLTSDNGLKILWQKLQDVYPSLKPREKAYFNSNINAPCPYKGAVKKTSAIYFWKFLNQYICAIGGPGRLIPKSGLNAYLTKNIKWRTNSTIESKGTSGGFPSLELPAILGHLGFRVGRDFRMVDFERWRYKFKNNSWTSPILMYSGGHHTAKFRDLLLEKRGYDLTGAIVYVKPALGSNRMPHVWSCSIRNGKGYVCDSNDPTTQTECSWWLKERLEDYFRGGDEMYRTGRALVMGFDVIMYTRKEFTNKIAPTCQLPQAYRPLTANNENKLRQFQKFGSGGVKFLLSGSVGAAHRRFTPRVLAEGIRRNAQRPIMTARVYTRLLNMAKSFNDGMNILQRVQNPSGLRYKVNENGQNYKNYRKKLIAKFPPRPFPKDMFIYFWRNSNSNREFANRVRNFANRGVYTVNENKLRGILARRATTRTGTKRAEERVYRLGNKWVNSNLVNVTNKINKANWVLNENPNKSFENIIKNMTEYNGNVKTYRRK
jgi:hypothetical protein